MSTSAPGPHPQSPAGQRLPANPLAHQQARRSRLAGPGDRPFVLGFLESYMFDCQPSPSNSRATVRAAPSPAAGGESPFVTRKGHDEESHRQYRRMPAARRNALRLDPLSSSVSKADASVALSLSRFSKANARFGRYWVEIVAVWPRHPWLESLLASLRRGRALGDGRVTWRASRLDQSR